MAISFGLDGSSKNKEGVQEIPSNKSLLIQNFTDLPPLLPEIIKGLQTPKAIFQYFKPSIHVVFDNLDKGHLKETIHFNNMEDFDSDKIAARSHFLSSLEHKKSIYFDIVTKLQNNKKIGNVVNNKDSKAILLKRIKELKEEIKTIK